MMMPHQLCVHCQEYQRHKVSCMFYPSIVIMYDRGSSESSVNGEIRVLFTHKVREIENIPLTQDALAQHVLIVGYEAGHVWGQATIKAPQLRSPANFGCTWEVAHEQWNMK